MTLQRGMLMKDIMEIITTKQTSDDVLTCNTEEPVSIREGTDCTAIATVIQETANHEEMTVDIENTKDQPKYQIGHYVAAVTKCSASAKQLRLWRITCIKSQ